MSEDLLIFIFRHVVSPIVIPETVKSWTQTNSWDDDDRYIVSFLMN